MGDRRLAAFGERYMVALRAADAPAAEAVVVEALGAGVAPTTIQVRVIMAAAAPRSAPTDAVRY